MVSLVSGRREANVHSTNFPCAKVFMLNPSVGLMLLMSSPLSFFRIVVFPALSKPLRLLSWPINTGHVLNSQKEQPHFLLFLAILSNDCKKTHVKGFGSV